MTKRGSRARGEVVDYVQAAIQQPASPETEKKATMSEKMADYLARQSGMTMDLARLGEGPSPEIGVTQEQFDAAAAELVEVRTLAEEIGIPFTLLKRAYSITVTFKTGPEHYAVSPSALRAGLLADLDQEFFFPILLMAVSTGGSISEGSESYDVDALTAAREKVATWVTANGGTVPVPEKSGCYVATAVYGSYDCPEVWVLRRYRDAGLMRHRAGRLLVRAYYAISPALVRRFGGSALLRESVRRPLDHLVAALSKRGYSTSRYLGS